VQRERAVGEAGRTGGDFLGGGEEAEGVFVVEEFAAEGGRILAKRVEGEREETDRRRSAKSVISFS
jgi:hypothetical protein